VYVFDSSIDISFVAGIKKEKCQLFLHVSLEGIGVYTQNSPPLQLMFSGIAAVLSDIGWIKITNRLPYRIT
jgi:hypothetical protein